MVEAEMRAGAADPNPVFFIVDRGPVRMRTVLCGC
jgi:hypothetical protein